MTASVSLRTTADVLEQLESGDATVREVRGAGQDGRLYDGDHLGTDVHVRLPLLADINLPDGLSATVSEAEADGDDLRVTVSIRPEDEPAYRDPDALREVYNAHDTFPEMTAALGVDVEPQTVRKHMVRHGIHEPERDSPLDRSADIDDERTETDDTGDANRSDEADADSDEADTANGTNGTDDASDADDAERGSAESGKPIDGHIAADGLGLPEGLTLGELRAALEGARTLHEVQCHTGVERERLKRCLGNLGLLDLVIGRTADADNGVTAEEIDRRIARATA